MTRTWACAAVVFRDTEKVFRFPLDRPDPPMTEIKREFRKQGVNVDDSDAFLEVLIKGFVEYLRPLQPQDVRPDMPTSSAFDISRWLMVITKVANKRYWVISVTSSLVMYHPIYGRSFDEGVALVESVIANPDWKHLLSGVTIH